MKRSAIFTLLLFVVFLIFSSGCVIPGIPTVSPITQEEEPGNLNFDKPKPPDTPVKDISQMSHAEFIDFIGTQACDSMKSTGVPASVTAAQAILETGWGKSTIQDAKNLFGIKGTGPAGSVEVPTREYKNGQWVTETAKFRKYNTYAESITDHAKLISGSSYYKEAMKDTGSPDDFANHLTGVYATDPEYGKKLISIMKTNNLYQYDTICKGGSGTSGSASGGTTSGGGTSAAQPGPVNITDPAMKSPWKQVDAPVKNAEGSRSVDNYLAVILQFDVQNSYPDRYKAGGSGLADTRCNIFAGDVMRAMGAPVPTKGELGHGAAGSKNTDPMTANASDLNNWLKSEKNGWRMIDVNNPADLALLQEQLQAGKPALASDPGHIAVLRPDQLPSVITKDNLSQLHIAQAGAFNSNDTLLKNAGYGGKFNPQFFIHE